MDPALLRTILEAYYQEVRQIILVKQNPVTGLLPASVAVTAHGDYRDAWVRDNVYSVLSVWALGLAYRRLDDDAGRGYELEQRTVHLMRGLLRSMMAQAAKVEAFKHSRRPEDALHAKYDTETGDVVVGDNDWGHLQLDATSLYLLMLAQMISSGLNLIWTTDEVNFVQNLVYYIERAYRTPDYGIWERGDKSNRGKAELNASSIGMAKAALEALSGFNLFGAHGRQGSVIHVSPDNIAQANLTLSSMLPRESNTKEIDAALLSIIGYPAYAVQPKAAADKVRRTIIRKLEGNYGLKRFLRDGHQTVLEDEGRLHYENAELKRFENIESEWPLFFTYLYLDAAVTRDAVNIEKYEAKLARTLVEREGQQLIPELYYVPKDAIDAERQHPGSQTRQPNDNVPLVWAQSLYLMARMIRSGILEPGDIDPLGRRRNKSRRQPVVQLAFIAEDEDLQAELAAHGVLTETPEDIAPVEVYLPMDIAEAYGQVGRNAALRLTGRAARALKSLTTSRFYRLGSRNVVCLASFFLQRDFFLAYDLDFVVRRFESEISYLYQNWTQPGRPTVTVLLTRTLLDTDRTALYELMQQIASGSVNGVPVRRGTLAELAPTACVERIDDLNGYELRNAPLRELVAPSRTLSQRGMQEPLSALTERTIDTIDTPSQLVKRLGRANNLYEQIELLAVLARLSPLETRVTVGTQESTLSELIGEVYNEAGHLRLWAVVRRAAGLLGKVDGDLSLAVGAILVRRKNVQVGRAYSSESLISSPLPEHELLNKIATFCRDDVRDRVLTQELLLYISLLINSEPLLFKELTTIRIGHIITLLTSKIAVDETLAPDAAYERLMHLAPSEIQMQLRAVLLQFGRLSTLPQELEHLTSDVLPLSLGWTPDLGLDDVQSPKGGWLAWRRHQGIIDRRPNSFYEDAWNIFEHTTALIIGEKLDRRSRMESAVVLSDTTAGEPAFALWIEHLLNKIGAPEYRQLSAEALTVLSSFFKQNAALHVKGDLTLDSILGHAVKLACIADRPELEAKYNEVKADAWQSFYNRPPSQTSGYIAASLRQLLQS